MEQLKINYELIRGDLKAPKTQITEVLRELIRRQEKGCSTVYFVSKMYVLNPQDSIMNLRRMGLSINCEMFKTKNKHGRPVKFGIYKLADVSKAISLYRKLLKDA